MGHNSPSPHDGDGGDGDKSSSGIRDRLRLKRNPKSASVLASKASSSSASSLSDRRRSHVHGARSTLPRKLLSIRGTNLFYLCLLIVVFAFALVSMVLQSSIASMVFRQAGAGEAIGRTVREGLKFGSSLKFVELRSERDIEIESANKKARAGIRSPRLAIIVGNMKNDPSSLMLLTMMKNLRGLGYILQIYATEDGKTKPTWEKTIGQVSILSPENYGHIDWSTFDGVIVNSLEAHDAISSLMQEPFCSVQLIWIIQEDTLANRLTFYEEMEWVHLIAYWKNAFRRADVVVFPDYSLSMLYSVLDTGNFFVIPGSPIDVWAAERYQKAHSKSQLRVKNGFGNDDMLVLVVGSSFFYNDLSWDYAVAMHNLGPLLTNYAREGDIGPLFKFVFVCGNSSSAYNDALQVAGSQSRAEQGGATRRTAARGGRRRAEEDGGARRRTAALGGGRRRSAKSAIGLLFLSVILLVIWVFVVILLDTMV